MPEQPLEIEVRQPSADMPLLVAVAGEIDVATSQQFRSVLAQLLEGTPRITIDLSRTSFIDSSGLGVLVAALERSQELDHELTLRGLQPPIRRVFEITGLTTLFAVED